MWIYALLAKHAQNKSTLLVQLLTAFLAKVYVVETEMAQIDSSSHRNKYQDEEFHLENGSNWLLAWAFIPVERMFHNSCRINLV